MNSRFLARMDARIAECGPGEARDALVAERASYLARLGHVDEARQVLSDLRLKWGETPSARVSSLVHIADGLCHYYTDMGPEARDRFLRAHALARAASLGDVVVRAASWLALVHYGAYRFPDMVRSLDECFLGTPHTDPSTLARSCLVVAQTIHLANRFDLALPWYRRVRLLSAETEDEATISALMHNMASIWATNSRNALLGGPPTRDSSRQALAGAMSTLNFDDLVGLTNLSVFTPLLRAQVCSIEGDCEQALLLYENHLSALSLKAVQGWQVWLLADKGWCQLQTGKSQLAKESCEAGKSALTSDMHVDDRAATLTRLSRAYAKFGDGTEAERCEVEAGVCWRDFAALQELMLSAVESSRGVRWMADQRP